MAFSHSRGNSSQLGTEFLLGIQHFTNAEKFTAPAALFCCIRALQIFSPIDFGGRAQSTGNKCSETTPKKLRAEVVLVIPF
uniref:Uncharacterized protein n=1 Tax=Salvator merianae TaxID=96440 RepID=A0A8D0CF28_SALMN